MTATPSNPVQSCQPKPAELRRDPPVCVYCDNDLSCGHCGVEQPYDDISLLKARIEELEAALRDFIDILEGAQSGFIPGCGSDEAWKRGRDQRIADARALLEPKP